MVRELFSLRKRDADVKDYMLIIALSVQELVLDFGQRGYL